jgi:Na+-translocating ferredoxin:NAD+ oxidoreductase RnfD subunit
VGSKQLLRVGHFHLFNPAAAGLLGALLLVPAGQSWWGALADLPAQYLAIPLLGGSIVVWRVKKEACTLAFFGAYFAAFTLAALVLPGLAPAIAAVFRPPFINAALFSGFLMLTDPATSPTRSRDQLVFGAMAAVVSAAAFLGIHGLHFLFIGLLVANAWYAWRRTTLSHDRQETLATAA